MQRAVASHREGDNGQAIADCERALRERPDEPEALHLAATLYASAGQLTDALPFAQRALQCQPGNSRYLCTLGRLLNATGESDRAETLFREAIDIDPTLPVAWQGLAMAQKSRGRRDQGLATLGQAAQQLGKPALYRDYAVELAQSGRLEEAVTQLEKVLATDPHDAAATGNLGILRLRLGRPAEAAACFEALLQQDRGNMQALRNLAYARQAEGKFAPALNCLDAISRERTLNAEELASRGSILVSLGQRAAAGSAFEDALRLEPAQPAALAGKAEVLEFQGRYEEGLAVLMPFLDSASHNPVIALAAGRLLRRLGRTKEAAALLLPCLEQQLSDIKLSRRLLFTLGEIHDELGEYETAFAYFRDAHAISPKKFAIENHRSWVRQTIGLYSTHSTRGMPRAERGSPDVIFIIGMPRSGTSLVEQILASHPGVQPGGERSDIGVLAQELLPGLIEHGLASISVEQLSTRAEAYLRGAGKIPARAMFITDKMPLNFLYLGLIAMLFPGARIVHCRRDPLDTAISCYFTDFLDPALAFSEDLQTISQYYEQYQLLMDHWTEVLELAIHEVVYEDLVRGQEKTTRALLEFVGLPWDERCLHFHNSERNVDTASHAQVRRPIYTSSVGRSAHYARQLASLRQMLSES